VPEREPGRSSMHHAAHAQWRTAEPARRGPRYTLPLAVYRSPLAVFPITCSLPAALEVRAAHHTAGWLAL